MKNIGEQEKESTENEITTYEDVETPGRIHNDGNYENPVLSSPQDNNAFSPGTFNKKWNFDGCLLVHVPFVLWVMSVGKNYLNYQV